MEGRYKFKDTPEVARHQWVKHSKEMRTFFYHTSQHSCNHHLLPWRGQGSSQDGACSIGKG